MTRHAASRRWHALLLAAALLVALVVPAHAHDTGGALRVHAFVRADGDRLQVVLRVPLELLLNVDLPKRGNGYLDLARVDEAFPRALRATTKGIAFFADGERLEPLRSDARIALPSDPSFKSHAQALAAVRGAPLPVSTDVYWNQGYFDAAFEYPLRSADAGIAVDFLVAPGLGDKLKLDLRYQTSADAVRAFELVTGAGVVRLDPRWYQASFSFVQSGFQHILGGADHLLFLLCLIVPFRRIGWPLVGVITAFTIAHSITLIAAAFGIVPGGAWFPPLVELLIAASILYMAIENVLRPNLRWRWLLSGLFGLVHGFGFSFGLANELQFVGSHLVLSLLAFNVGIELGQLLVLALALPLLVWLMRRMDAHRARGTEGAQETQGRGERLVVAVLSAFVAHSAWHWLTERFDALQKVPGPVFDAALRLQFAIGVLLLLALALLALALRQRRVSSSRRLTVQGSQPD